MQNPPKFAPPAPASRDQQDGGTPRYECRHLDDMDWEVQRFAGILKYEPGHGHPVHGHHFAQVWYILEGQFDIGGKMYGPDTMVYHPDPHVEDRLHTETGGKILFIQYQGPTTGERPIYDGRFN